MFRLDLILFSLFDRRIANSVYTRSVSKGQFTIISGNMSFPEAIYI